MTKYVIIENAVCKYIEIGEKFTAEGIIEYLPKRLQNSPSAIGKSLSISDKFEPVEKTTVKGSTNYEINVWERIK